MVRKKSLNRENVRQYRLMSMANCISKLVFRPCRSLSSVATAGSKGEAGVAATDSTALVGHLFKPLSEALHKEQELEPADALLSIFLETL